MGRHYDRMEATYHSHERIQGRRLRISPNLRQEAHAEPF